MAYPIQSLHKDFNYHPTTRNPAVLVALLQTYDPVQRYNHILNRLCFGPLETQVAKQKRRHRHLGLVSIGKKERASGKWCTWR